jgi:hypothetical protein
VDESNLHAIIAACRARGGYLDLRWDKDDLARAVVHLSDCLLRIKADNYDRGHEAGRDDEREDLVSWLRRNEPQMTPKELASAIERCDHLYPKEDM